MTEKQCNAESCAARVAFPSKRVESCFQVVDDRWQGKVCTVMVGQVRTYAWMIDDKRAHSMPHRFPVESPMDAISAWLLMRAAEKDSDDGQTQKV